MPNTRCRPAFTLVELLVVIAIIGILIALLLPAVQAARESGRRARCQSNLHQLALALLNHEMQHGALPLGVEGRPTHVDSDLMHTWFTRILPFVEQEPLQRQYRFDRRFDHAQNLPVIQTRLPIFECPSVPPQPLANDLGPNHYAGNGGTLPSADDGLFSPQLAVRLGHITDGTTNTLAVGEIVYDVGGWGRGVMPGGSSGSGGGGGGGGGGGTGGSDSGNQGYSRGVLRWWRCVQPCATPGINPAPSNCNNSCEQRTQFSSLHPDGANFSFLDGRAEFIHQRIDPNVLYVLITRAGNDLVGEY